MKANLAIWITKDVGAFSFWTGAFWERRTCPFLLENDAQGDGTGIFQSHVWLPKFLWKWNGSEVLKAWMHHFYNHKYFFCHQLLQRGLLPSIAQYSSLAFVCNICLPGLGICKGGSFSANFFNYWTASMWVGFHFGGDFSTILLNNFCIWRFLEWNLTCNLQFQETIVFVWHLWAYLGIPQER